MKHSIFFTVLLLMSSSSFAGTKLDCVKKYHNTATQMLSEQLEIEESLSEPDVTPEELAKGTSKVVQLQVQRDNLLLYTLDKILEAKDSANFNCPIK